ncbi:MAG: hypothetical protein ACF8R7_09645, partial [Phycisphaerales bacterium JB039]
MTRARRTIRRGLTGAAALLRALAGAPAGASRRGSTIVLVVSSLALFAVIAIAYVGLGRSDRRTGAVTVAQAQTDDVVVKVRDYLAGVIGRDSIAVFVEANDPAGDPVIVREGWDYPWTDPNRRSSIQGLGGAGGAGATLRFDPAGTMPAQLVEDARQGALPPVFLACDPWLASTEPMWLPRPGDTPSDPYYLDLLSWWQISNFAPDGRFVNLHALRADFDARPGVGAGEMSDDLILLDDLGRPQSSARTVHGEQADKRIPAHWTMFQQGAARPAGPGLDTGGRFANPGSPAYAPYSWVDADGDGILDSRWFELVDAFDPNNIVSLLPRDTRWRWFVGARAIDLSSLVNVNTAREIALGGEPTAENPLGQTPSDVDLLRLLTLEDIFSLVRGTASYGDIHQPAGGPADYSAYASSFAEAAEIGRLGYQGLKETATTGSAPSAQDQLTFKPTLASERDDVFADLGSALPGQARATGLRLRNSAAFGLQDLVELLAYHGLNDSSALSSLEKAVGGRDLTTPWFSPLRDNRPLEVESWADLNGDGRLDDERLALLAMDPRRRLTTLSGATHRRSTRVLYASAQDIPGAIGTIYADEAPARVSAPAAISLATQTTAPDPAPLFLAYAEALAPGAGEQNAWTDTAYRTMFYGYDPIFALRAAAHMTANRIDSYDRGDPASVTPDDQPTGMTLLINRNERSVVEGDTTTFPWWSVQESVSGGGTVYPRRLDFQLDPADERLPDGSAPGAINVYGIEAQPFLTEAASFIMYTDVPYPDGDGPGSEWIEAAAPGVGFGTVEPGQATIKGNLLKDNRDFIFQALAFQLTNPFDEELNLEDYFIEFGGYRYNLNRVSGEPIVLGRRDSVLVYYLSEEESKVQERMERAVTSSISASAIGEWINHQFTEGGSVIGGSGETEKAIPLERRPDVGIGGSGSGGIAGDVSLLKGRPGDPLELDNRQVLLWRTLDVPGGSTHDMLVDRLRDPAGEMERPTLDRRLPGGQNKIEDTVVGPPPGYPDDSGFSMTLFGSIRRPEDPKADPIAVMSPMPRGGVPAYCLEARFDNGLKSAGAGSWNLLPLAEDEDKINPTSLNRSDFAGATKERNAERELASLIQDQTGRGAAGSSEILVDTLKQEPWAKDTDRAILADDQIAGLEYWSLDPELHIGPQRGDPVRLADMLMAMAIGPVEDPFDPRYLADTERPEEKWTTLSEMLALALGYDNLPAGIGGAGTVLTQAGPPPQLWQKTDRGFLKLDAFAPFIDTGGNGVFDADADISRAAGVPMALAVLDAFRPFSSDRTGTLTNPAIGVININTAPTAVLRTLGILSPTASPLRQWLPTSHDFTSDIAATVEALRDKKLVFPRDYGASTPPLSFMSDGSGTGPQSDGPADPKDIDGRALHTGVDGVREQPGFRSIGELMLARDTLRSGGGIGGAGYILPHDIDRIGLADSAMTDRK